MSGAAEEPRTFSALAVGVLIAVGVFAFAAFFVLSAYAPALRGGEEDGRAHALSVSAVGYAALADLTEATGTDVILSRTPLFSDAAETLTVITPAGQGETGLEVPGPDTRVLIVAPKWYAAPDPERPSWVTLRGLRGGTAFDFAVAGHLIDLTLSRRGDRTPRGSEADEGADTDGDVPDGDVPGDAVPLGDDGVGLDAQDFAAVTRRRVGTRRTDPQDIALNPPAFDFGPDLSPLPAPAEIERVVSLQTVSGEHVAPVWTDDYGRIVLGRITVHPAYADGARAYDGSTDHYEDGIDYDAYVPSEIYVLADPDLLNTMGLARLANARAAAGLMAGLSNGRPVRFDLTEFGYARPQNLLTVALEPPFLAATLAGLSAALILALHAGVRFGPPMREVGGFALGKAALADNTAALLTASDKVGTLGPRYAKLARGRMAAALGLARADARLDERVRKALGGDDLAAATQAANAAQGAAPVTAAARTLHRIKDRL